MFCVLKRIIISETGGGAQINANYLRFFTMSTISSILSPHLVPAPCRPVVEPRVEVGPLEAEHLDHGEELNAAHQTAFMGKDITVLEICEGEKIVSFSFRHLGSNMCFLSRMLRQGKLHL